MSLFQQSCVTKHFYCRNCGACSYCFKPEVCIHCYAHASGWEGEEIAAGAAVIKSPEEWAQKVLSASFNSVDLQEIQDIILAAQEEARAEERKKKCEVCGCDHRRHQA